MTKKILFSTRMKQLAAVVFLLTFNFISAQAPTITSFSPTSGEVGSTVTITGSGFDSTRENNVVYFGGMKATVTAATSTELRVTVPGGTSNTEYITVVNTVTRLSFKYFRHFNVTKAISHSLWSTNTFSTSFQTSASVVQNPDINLQTRKEVKVMDVNNDNKPDIVYTDESGNIRFLTNVVPTPGAMAASHFSLSNTIVTTNRSNPGPLELVDMNNDGLLDIVVTENFRIRIFPNTSSGGSISFGPQLSLTASVEGPSLAVGDFNNDGRMDIAISSRFSTEIRVFNNTSVDGSITFSSLAQGTTISFNNNLTGQLISTDINGDGFYDLVAAGEGSNNATVFMNITPASTTGRPTFGSGIPLQGASKVRGIASADINGDGFDDIVIGNDTGGRSVYINATGAGSSASYNASSFDRVIYNSTATGWDPLTNVSDINCDGKVDIIDQTGFLSTIAPIILFKLLILLPEF